LTNQKIDFNYLIVCERKLCFSLCAAHGALVAAEALEGNAFGVGIGVGAMVDEGCFEGDLPGNPGYQPRVSGVERHYV